MIFKILMALSIMASASLSWAQCSEDLCILTGTDSHLENLLKDLSHLTLEYRELPPADPKSLLFLKALNFKSLELESALNEANYSDAQKNAVKLRLSQLIESQSQQVRKDGDQELVEEQKARKEEVEADLLNPLFQLEKSEFTENFNQSVQDHFAPVTSHLYITAYEPYILVSGRDLEGQKQRAVLIDGRTGLTTKIIDSKAVNKDDQIILSADQTTIYSRRHIKDYKENFWYVLPVKDILGSSGQTVILDEEQNKVFDPKDQGLYPYGYYSPELLSTDKMFFALHEETPRIVIKSVLDFEKDIMSFEFPPDVRIRHLINKDMRQGAKVQSFDGDKIGFYTRGDRKGETYISIFDINTRAYLGSLVANDTSLGTFNSFVLNKDLELVIGSYENGIATWDLKKLNYKIKIKPETALYEHGRTNYTPFHGFSLSPNSKYVAFQTIAPGKGLYFIDVYSFDSHKKLKFEQRIKAASFFETNDAGSPYSIVFTSDSRRILVLRKTLHRATIRAQSYLLKEGLR